MVSNSWSWLLISALIIGGLVASESCEIGFGELLQINEVEKEGKAVENHAGMLRPRGAKPTGTGNFQLPDIVRGRPVNAQNRPPPRTVAVRSPGQPPRRPQRDEYQYEQEAYEQPRQREQRRQREEPEYYPEEQYFEEEQHRRRPNPRQQRQDYQMEQPAAPRTQRIRVMREGEAEREQERRPQQQRAQRQPAQDPAMDRRAVRQQQAEAPIMDRRPQRGDDLDRRGPRAQQAVATRDRAERRQRREQQMAPQMQYDQEEYYEEEEAPRPRQHRQRRERDYQEDEEDEYAEYMRQQQQQQQPQQRDRRQDRQRQHPADKVPQGPQLRDENHVLQEALRLMEQGQQVEEEPEQASLILEQWNGDEEGDGNGGDGFFEVNDVSEAPRDRRQQRPEQAQLARPSPPRPHRLAQAAGERAQRKPAAGRVADKVPPKKPASNDPRFLMTAERKTPIAQGQHVEEFEFEESEDSGLGSGSVYVPFPPWMDYMNQVEDPSSNDLHFNVPIPGMQGEAKDIFTHLGEQEHAEQQGTPMAAVEAIAKRTFAYRR